VGDILVGGVFMMRVALAISALLFVAGGQPNWMLYGTSMLGREELRSFYGDWTVMPNGHLQVATEDLTSEGIEVAKRIDPTLSRATSKLATGYRPPLAGLRSLSNGELVDVVEAEEIAKSGVISARFQTLREVDCAGRRFRVLSLVEASVEADSEKLNQSWQQILPSTSNYNLLRLICR
jgi:hypothetical protein